MAWPNRAFLSIALFCLVEAVACTPGDAGAPSGFTVDTLPSGTVQVVNDGSGQWDESSSWSLVEELRLGSVGSGGPDQFSQVASIVTDSTGSLFILDIVCI